MRWSAPILQPVIDRVAASELRAGADDTEVPDLAAGAELGVVADDRADHGGRRSDRRARADDGVLDERAARKVARRRR